MAKNGKKRKSYTAGERRAYWLGVGFHAASMGMSGDKVYSCMTEKEKDSFVNGRTAADNRSPKFVPDYVSDPNSGKHSNRKK